MRARAALAGAVAVAVCVGLAELFAAILPTTVSPLNAVDQVVVEATPGPVVRWAIETFATANRAVLATGTIVLALAIGAVVAIVARRAFWVAVVVFSLVAVVALAAGLRDPDAALPTMLVALVAASAGGLVLLERSLKALDRTGGEGGAGAAGDTAPRDVDRRRFLALVVGGGVGSALAFGLGRAMLRAPAGPPAAADVMLPPASRPLPAVAAEQDLATRLDGVSPILTPNDVFYRIDTAIGVPHVDTDGWTLRITGLVEQEVELRYEDLLDLPLEELDATIACVSNEVGGDLVGTARWSGVPLETLLDRAVPTADAEQVIGRATDGWTGGFPIEMVADSGALVAVGMNGEPLPDRHGFPARLIVPGLYGYVSATKWLAEIELATWEGFDAYWIDRGWSKRGPVKISSRIDRPGQGAAPAPGTTTVAGVAWAPTRGIDRVELRVDEGRWRPATLVPALADTTWVQWYLDVELAAGRHILQVRATDGDGQLQPEGPQPPFPDGAEGWHAVSVRVG